MIRSVCIAVLLILASSIAFGQSTKSVVKLNNGVILKGEIVEFTRGDYMIIHLMDGYDMRISLEDVRSFKIKDGKLKEYNLPSTGYFNYTSGGFLFLKGGRYDWVEVNMTVHTINGYRFHELYNAGLGVGLDRYGTTTSLPVYLSVRRDLFASRVTPMFNANVGYGWMWESDSYNEWEDFDNVKGGLYWELGAGLRINYKKTALIFNYAYKRQNSELTMTDDFWWREEDTVVEHHNFRNMTLTVGLEF